MDTMASQQVAAGKTDSDSILFWQERLKKSVIW